MPRTYTIERFETGEVLYADTYYGVADQAEVALRKIIARAAEARRPALVEAATKAGREIGEIVIERNAENGMWVIRETGERIRISGKYLPKASQRPAQYSGQRTSISNFEYRNLASSLGPDAAAQMARMMQG